MRSLKRLNDSKRSFAILFASTAILASSCAVPIKNQRHFGDAGPDGAFYFETLTDVEGQLTKQEWDDLRTGMICTDAQNYADTKGVIEKLCHQTGSCTYAEVEQMRRFFERVEKFHLRMTNGVSQR